MFVAINVLQHQRLGVHMPLPDSIVSRMVYTAVYYNDWDRREQQQSKFVTWFGRRAATYSSSTETSHQDVQDNDEEHPP